MVGRHDDRATLPPMSDGTVLEALTLANFRNLAAQKLTLGPGLHFVSGPNGAGKTNLLDAIYYLCIGRSHFSYGDSSAIAHDENWLRLAGQFSVGSAREAIALKIQPRKGKSIERNGVAYDSIVEHVGRLPAVMISPSDIELVVGGPDERRRFLDQTLSQTDPQYLKTLLTYNRLLKLRNALLKDAAHPLEVDLTLLGTYDRQLEAPAQRIFEKRRDFVISFQPDFSELYATICGGVETPALQYASKLAERPYRELLMQSRDHDLYLKRTNVGPHRDELDLKLAGEGIRKFASQGQIKTFVISLRLAQARVLGRLRGRTPILLLDDLFDRLDPARVQHLVDLVQAEDYAQVFVSDTHPDRLLAIDVRDAPARYYSVAEGKIAHIVNPDPA